MKVLDAETALEFLEIETERLWIEATIAAIKAGKKGTIRKLVSALERVEITREYLELVRKTKGRI